MAIRNRVHEERVSNRTVWKTTAFKFWLWEIHYYRQEYLPSENYTSVTAHVHSLAKI